MQTIVFLATAWGSKAGGINTFNMEIARATAASLGSNGKVVCIVPKGTAGSAVELGKGYWTDAGVMIVDLGLDRDDAFDMGWVGTMWTQLQSAGITSVDWWIGHDVVSGDAANRARKDTKQGHSAVFMHMSYRDYQGYKHASAREAQRKHEKQRKMFEAADQVFAVGPLLRDRASELASNVKMIIPGLPDVPSVRPPQNRIEAIAFGRLDIENDRIKQVSLAVAAFASACRTARVNPGAPLLRGNDVTLKLIGIGDESEEEKLRTLAQERAGRFITVTALPYEEDRVALMKQVAASNLAMMLSWHEGFGLTGWEALAAEVPLITSAASGLCQLLTEEGLRGSVHPILIDGALRSVEDSVQLPFTNDDQERVARCILDISVELDTHRKTAQELKKNLVAKGYSWSKASEELLATLSRFCSERAGIGADVQKILPIKNSTAEVLRTPAPLEIHSREGSSSPTEAVDVPRVAPTSSVHSEPTSVTASMGAATVALLHLSDLRFRSEGHVNPVVRKVEALVSAISSELHSSSGQLYIVVSGDIAFSGRAGEYAIASKFFEQLQARIIETLKLQPVFLFVPGNSDLDHEAEPPGARNVIIDNIATVTLDQSIVDVCLRPQKEYFRFAESSMRGASVCSYGVIHEIACVSPGGRIVFRLYNSAWMSTRYEAQGRLVLPRSVLNQPVTSSETAVVVAVLHHSLGWFESANAKSVLNSMETSADIVLTGHALDPGMVRRERYNGAPTQWVEGGILQSRDGEDSSFNLILINPKAEHYQTRQFCWSSQKRAYELMSPDATELPFRRNVGRLKGAFALSEQFSERLSEAMSCVHYTGTRPRLEDLFVYPDLRPIVSGSEKRTMNAVTDPVGYVLQERHVLIAGVSQAGKTSLARQLFKDLREKAVIPVLVHGSDLKSGYRDKVLDLVEKSFSEQYSGTSPQAYTRRDVGEKAIIIDDWQECRLNQTGRQGIVGTLLSAFGVVVIIAGEELLYEEIVNASGDISPFYEFSRCEIMPLGHRKRDLLIERWYELGQTHADDEVALAQRAARATQMVSTCLGRGLPCYPPWLIIWLQGIDTNNADPRHVGSQGYLLQALITLTLRNASRGKVQDDVLLNYLSELANEIYSSNSLTLRRADLVRWHYAFNEKYALKIDLNAIREVLEKAGTLLVLPDESVQFKFRGILWFFVARYLADRINDNAVRQRIEDLAMRVYQDDASGILNSLTYLTKDPFVVETLMSRAKSILQGVPNCDLVADTKFVSSFSETIQELVIEEHNARKNRQALLERRDSTESAVDASMFEVERSPEDPMFNILASLKMIEVLGQVLRNFYGSIVAERKVEIAEECFSLGLRLLKYALDGLQRDPEGVAKFAFETLRHGNAALDHTKLQEESRGFVQRLAYGVGVGMVRHVSNSVGHESLQPVFEQLLRRKIVAYDVIGFSVELDHYRTFPFGSLECLKQAVEKKVPYAMRLVQYLVWQHLYIFPMQRVHLVKACEAAGISHRTLIPALVQRGR